MTYPFHRSYVNAPEYLIKSNDSLELYDSFVLQSCHVVIGCKGLIGSASSNYLSSCGYTLVGLDIGDQPEELSFLQEYYSFNLSDALLTIFYHVLQLSIRSNQYICSYVKPKNWA